MCGETTRWSGYLKSRPANVDHLRRFFILWPCGEKTGDLRGAFEITYPKSVII